MKGALTRLYPVISIILIVVLWWICALILNIEYMLPTPAKTFKDLTEIFADKRFYQGVSVTTAHALLAFALSFACAFACALLASFSKIFESLFYPLVVILRVIPTMSIIFLSLIWLSSTKSPYLVVFLIIFPLLYSSFLSAIKGVDKELIQMSNVYCVRKKDLIFSLYLPSIAKSVYANSLSTLSLAVKLAIAGEALSLGGVSLGFLMQSAKANLETGLLIAYTVVAIVLGFLFELLVKAVAKIIVKVRCKYAKIN